MHGPISTKNLNQTLAGNHMILYPFFFSCISLFISSHVQLFLWGGSDFILEMGEMGNGRGSSMWV